jgi:tetratricopeptide (TPR) repeat protein
MLRQLHAREPRSVRAAFFFPQALAGRAAALSKLSRPEEAEQCFRRLQQLHQEMRALAPSDSWTWFVDAPLRLRLGDFEGYRQVCRELVARASQSDDPAGAGWTALTCLVVPEGLVDLGPVLQLAKRAVTGMEQRVEYRWFLLTRGMADYRTGDFHSAVERLTKALSLVGEPRDAQTRCMVGTAYAFLAMACHRLDQALEARQALAQATALGKQNKHPGPDWHYWLRFDIVRLEAERLVNGEAGPRTDRLEGACPPDGRGATESVPNRGPKLEK